MYKFWLSFNFQTVKPLVELRTDKNDPVHQRIDFKIATTAFKVLHYQKPSYLAEILPKYTPSRSLRSSGSTIISVPLRKTSMVSLKSFSSVASIIWNKLPRYLTSVQTRPVFRKHLKHHLFLQAYHGFIPPAIYCPHNAFQHSAYDLQFHAIVRDMLHTCACANAALLTYLIEAGWNIGKHVLIFKLPFRASVCYQIEIFPKMKA